MAKTVAWYLENEKWVEDVTSGAYRAWVDVNYAKRGVA
jgi:dTDP-glucose 4,6-dehydratase